ncbi:MAG: CDP-alcohol phosphatidyltransferase family protein [Planctomycetes bacterium]|nr:CDP-alcohol phosphatidyltransferase family protein [Planctomycetota bacterium]
MLAADRITLARLVLAPLAVAAYLLLPMEGNACLWAAGWICGAAEFTDWLDGRVARARNEVSDFGKLADPFCDVFYRMLVYLALLLPAGGVGFTVTAAQAADLQQSVHLVGIAGDGSAILGAGLMPWLPVVLMVMREIVQGAVRAMCAARGLVLAARWSGKAKAWVQGVVLITSIGLPAVFFGWQEWMLHAAAWGCWAAALLSLASLGEYLWVNRSVLGSLARRTA